MKTSDFNEKLAILAVKYALDVQPKKLVVIEEPEVSNDLMLAIIEI